MLKTWKTKLTFFKNKGQNSTKYINNPLYDFAEILLVIKLKLKISFVLLLDYSDYTWLVLELWKWVGTRKAFWSITSLN